MYLDIIIVNHNQEDHLKKCLSSLFSSTNKKFSVIVVDNEYIKNYTEEFHHRKLTEIYSMSISDFL